MNSMNSNQRSIINYIKYIIDREYAESKCALPDVIVISQFAKCALCGFIVSAEATRFVGL